MKTELITVLASPAFKSFLIREAKTAKVSVSELIRQRCEMRLSPDEQLLATLSEQLHQSNRKANEALDTESPRN